MQSELGHAKEIYIQLQIQIAAWKGIEKINTALPKEKARRWKRINRAARHEIEAAEKILENAVNNLKKEDIDKFDELVKDYQKGKNERTRKDL